MTCHGEQTGTTPPRPFVGTAPPEFLTAFRSGTGGHRVIVLPDRIVIAYRHGGTSQLPIDDIRALSTFETVSSQPAYGVQVERRSPARDVGYLFEDDATRRMFLRAVALRMTPGTA